MPKPRVRPQWLHGGVWSKSSTQSFIVPTQTYVKVPPQFMLKVTNSSYYLYILTRMLNFNGFYLILWALHNVELGPWPDSVTDWVRAQCQSPTARSHWWSRETPMEWQRIKRTETELNVPTDISHNESRMLTIRMFTESEWKAGTERGTRQRDVNTERDRNIDKTVRQTEREREIGREEVI